MGDRGAHLKKALYRAGVMHHAVLPDDAIVVGGDDNDRLPADIMGIMLWPRKFSTTTQPASREIIASISNSNGSGGAGATPRRHRRMKPALVAAMRASLRCFDATTMHGDRARAMSTEHMTSYTLATARRAPRGRMTSTLLMCDAVRDRLSCAPLVAAVTRTETVDVWSTCIVNRAYGVHTDSEGSTMFAVSLYGPLCDVVTATDCRLVSVKLARPVQFDDARSEQKNNNGKVGGRVFNEVRSRGSSLFDDDSSFCYYENDASASATRAYTLTATGETTASLAEYLASCIENFRYDAVLMDEYSAAILRGCSLAVVPEHDALRASALVVCDNICADGCCDDSMDALFTGRLRALERADRDLAHTDLGDHFALYEN